MNVQHSFAPLTMRKEHRSLRKAMIGFLLRLWDCHPESAVTFMAARKGSCWIEHPIKTERQAAITKFLTEYPSEEWDIYFCPNAFRGKRRKAERALPTPYAWCDIDDARPGAFKPRPNILWETSAGRFQGIWIWEETLAPLDAGNISKWLLHFGGDGGGWSITKMLRVPGTINHKLGRKNARVTLRRFDARLKRVPVTPQLLAEPCRSISASGDFIPTRFEAAEVIKRYRRRVSLLARTIMAAKRVIFPDRSEAIFVIVSELVKSGAENDEIGSILLSNPHFLEKHGEDWAMAEREIITIRAKVGGDR